MNQPILPLTLKVLIDIFHNCNPFLKQHLEMFLNILMSRVDAGIVGWDVEGLSNVSTQAPSKQQQQQQQLYTLQQQQQVISGETRELFLESIVAMTRAPGFVQEIWINFDGDEKNVAGHLFEELTLFYCKVRLLIYEIR
jgi:hypothetical protein